MERALKEIKNLNEATNQDKELYSPKEVLSLAFRVKGHGDGLYSAEMLLLKGSRVIDSKHSTPTTVGHAIGHMDNLADGWAMDMLERKPEDYFKEVFI